MLLEANRPILLLLFFCRFSPFFHTVSQNVQKCSENLKLSFNRNSTCNRDGAFFFSFFFFWIAFFPPQTLLSHCFPILSGYLQALLLSLSWGICFFLQKEDVSGSLIYLLFHKTLSIFIPLVLLSFSLPDLYISVNSSSST